MDIGFHISISGPKGYANAIIEANQFNLTAIQLFAKSPRCWRTRELKPLEAESFHTARSISRIRTIAIHSSYLINLGSSGDLWKKSIQSLKDDLDKAHMLGVEYIVLHPGSLDIAQIRKGISEAMEQSQSKVRILIENAAGGDKRLGKRFEDIAKLIENTSLGVCLDTCHAFAAGYPLHKDPKKFLDQLDSLIGLENIPLLHFNDSRGDFSSGIDRHAGLLEGKINASLKYFLQDPRLHDKAFIMEVPKEKFCHNLEIFHNWQNEISGSERLTGEISSNDSA
ncbi:deoxyribonuclease IV [Candidatus Odyssella acanthamoebae]|uniref:deoxyribonuclease IV n=1 Tax=Candidatus Odyssella acanthamoebae TaxID=91604 RepID=UPI00094B3D5D|nr:deoxyribonuclease IV [Candidatus Paracaedibacter acanthamoebae]